MERQYLYLGKLEKEITVLNFIDLYYDITIFSVIFIVIWFYFFEIHSKIAT